MFVWKALGILNSSAASQGDLEAHVFKMAVATNYSVLLYEGVPIYTSVYEEPTFKLPGLKFI